MARALTRATAPAHVVLGVCLALWPAGCRRVAPSVCGDGFFNPMSEECDDGNLAAGDGCSALCTFEDGSDAGASDAGGTDASAATDSTVPGSDAAPACGNGMIDGAEACDGANLAGESCVTLGFAGGMLACNAACTGFVTTGCTIAPGPVCGDGSVDAGEACDDGDLGGGDGCGATCAIEPGWTCSGSPSVCTPSGPTLPGAGELVITEVMRDPTAAADADGEWFEIHNPTASTFELMGLVVKDDGTDMFTIGTSLTIGPGGYLVLGNNGDPAVNGGIGLDYVYGIAMFISNSSDEIELRNGTTIVDRFPYLSASLPNLPGSALSLDPASTSATANDAPAAWCNAPTLIVPSPGTDYGSPGLPNPPCP